jgi:hypothetical protein
MSESGGIEQRQLSDEAIVETFRKAAAAHTELLDTVGKMHDALLAMSERVDLLQRKVLDLEQRLDRARR